MFQRILPQNFFSKRLLDKMPLLSVLILSSGLSVAIFAARVVYAHQWIYLFLNWNLFLAWIPLICALAAWQWHGNARRPGVITLGLLAVWLLFLPNSPYITTDLMHLTYRYPVPVWYDALLLFSYAWNGLIVGITSLWIVHSLVEQWVGRTLGWLFAGAALIASSFGIYLGRFLRWNSWDVLQEPHGLLHDIATRLLNPMDYPRTFVMTALFSGVLILMYVTMTALASVNWKDANWKNEQI